MSEPLFNNDSTVFPVSRKMSSDPKGGNFLSVLADLADRLDSLFQEVQAIKDRQYDLEWTLANENANLKDENIALRQRVVDSPDCFPPDDF
jgi:hypothetical protein